MSSIKNQAGCLNLRRAGWKYYNNIRKKAMEQEFSWSGLLTSMSIAFFIVIISASALNFINYSIMAGETREKIINKNVYYLESGAYTSKGLNGTTKNILI